MMDKLGVLLMEEEDGTIAVQLFADPYKARESFENMPGQVGQKPQRATFIHLEYDDKKVKEVFTITKDLPLPEIPLSERPDGYKLGEGPVKFEEKK